PHGVRVPPLWTARARGGSEVAEQRASEAGQDDRTIRRLIRRSALTTPRSTPANTARRRHGTPPARHAASTARRPVPPIPTAGSPDRGNGCACREAGGRNRGRDRSTRDGDGRARGTSGRTRGAGGPSQRRRVPRKSP